jgi:hypothetical protein
MLDDVHSFGNNHRFFPACVPHMKRPILTEWLPIRPVQQSVMCSSTHLSCHTVFAPLPPPPTQALILISLGAVYLDYDTLPATTAWFFSVLILSVVWWSEFLATDPDILGSLPGATTFS